MMKSESCYLLLLALLIGTSVEARRGGGGGNRPFGGGPFGGKHGFPGFEPEFVTKTCDASVVCPLGRKGMFGNERNGTFVCRTTYHPITGNPRTESRCIPTDKGFESDACGCCGDECPTRPEFQEITCDNQDDLLALITRGGFGKFFGDDGDDGADDGNRRSLFKGGKGDRGGGFGGFGGGGGFRRKAAIVCRELYNPFTGDKERKTIAIKKSKSLEGDVCGCCDGVCPDEIGKQVFERPDDVPLDFCQVDELPTCKLGKRQGPFETEEDREGVYVCRSMVNTLTGVAESQSVCVSTDAAWSTDQCGCCGGDCPVKPTRVELDCPAVEDQCERKNGRTGVFVCRSLYHPIEGNLVKASLCLPGDKGWEMDECGCCDDECLPTPEGGFPDEDAQLMAIALAETTAGSDGDETTTVAAAATTASGANASRSYRFAAMATGVIAAVGALMW